MQGGCAVSPSFPIGSHRSVGERCEDVLSGPPSWSERVITEQLFCG